MAPIRFILAATDFSPEGNNAVWRAATMARQSGARMGIVHVVDPAGYQPLRDWMMPCYPLDQKEARGLAQARQLAIDVANRFGLTPSVHVPVGEICEEVVAAAAKADLLVVGRPHKRRFRDWLTGRTADQILRGSRRPVLVSRNPVKGCYAKVLVPLDFRAGSDAALRAATQLAPEQSLGLFHAVNPAGETMMHDVRAREDQGTMARMRRQVTRLGLDHRVMHFTVGRGRSIDAAAEHARQQGAELVVIARPGRWSIWRLLRASVSTRLLQSVSCDLLVLPRPVDAPAQLPGSIALGGAGHNIGTSLSAGAGASLGHNKQFNWLGRP